MKKSKKVISKKKKGDLINLRMYGIFDSNKKEMLKVSLDSSEIEMELALMGGLGDNYSECEWDITLSI